MPGALDKPHKGQVNRVYYLRPSDPVIHARRNVEMVHELRRLGGAELNVKRCGSVSGAAAQAAALRRVLGQHFIVTREGCEIRARARLRGEHVPDAGSVDRRVWMSAEQAARKLRVAQAWLRRSYIDAGRVDTVTDSAGQVWCLRTDVHAIHVARQPSTLAGQGGAVLRHRRAEQQRRVAAGELGT